MNTPSLPFTPKWASGCANSSKSPWRPATTILALAAVAALFEAPTQAADLSLGNPQPVFTNDAPVARTTTTPYAAVHLGPNEKVWQRTIRTTLPDGRVTTITNRYTELATSMAYQRGDGAWVETNPQIDPVDGGAAATRSGPNYGLRP